MFILEVIPIAKSVRVSTLSYFSAKRVEPGMMVGVPLRKQEIKAIVVEVRELRDLKAIVKSADFQLRNIITIHQQQVFNSAYLNAAVDIANYDATSVGAVIDTLTPKIMLSNLESFNSVQTLQKDSLKQLPKILQRSTKDRYSYYKTRGRELLSAQESVFICCPTIEESVRVYNEISKGIEDSCFLLKNLTLKRIREFHNTIQEQKMPIILIGTPGTLALCPSRVKEFIIESSSSSSYRTITNPQFDTRFFIERLAYHQGARVIYADTVIDVTIWNRVHKHEISTIEPTSKRVLNPDELTIVSYYLTQGKQTEEDRIKELQHQSQGFHPLHIKVREALDDAIAKNEKVFLYVPKKGVAPNIVCNDCGMLAVSPTSGLPLSLYHQTNKKTGKKNTVYVCNATGEKIPAFDECQFCRGINLKNMGIGTSGLQKILTQMYLETSIMVIDNQHTKTKTAITKVQKEFMKKGPTIAIGTSKVFSVLDQWDTTVVVTLAPLFSIMSHTNEERAVRLLALLQERTRGTLYLQNRRDHIKHLPILKDGMVQPFVRNELSDRKELSYPPYGTIIKVVAHVSKNKLKEEYIRLLKIFESYDPAVMVRPHNKTQLRILIIIKLSQQQWSQGNQDEQLKTILRGFAANIQVEVNPLTLS